MVETRVRFENEDHLGESVTPAELAILNDQLFNVLAKDSALLTSLYRDNLARIQAGLEVAKKEVGGVFTGVAAGNAEIGLSHIRSGFINRTTGATETPDHDWSFAFAAGNDFWLGYTSDNDTALNIDARLLLVVLAVMFTQGGSPVVEDVQWQIGATTYPIEVLRPAWMGDNANGIRVARLRPKILKPKATALVQVRSTLAGENELVLLGVAFGSGAFLSLLNPTTVQT